MTFDRALLLILQLSLNDFPYFNLFIKHENPIYKQVELMLKIIFLIYKRFLALF